MKSLAKALHLEQLEARILLDGFVDLFEPNDDFAGAADLGPVVGAELVGGLTLHNDTDVDFFAFTTVAAATESHYVLMDVPCPPA